MSRNPRRDEYTIGTADAPDAVSTVCTYGHQATPRPCISAQIRFRSAKYPQASAMRCRSDPNLGPSQVTYGTKPLYGAPLVRNFSFPGGQTSRSRRQATANSRILS